MSNRLKPYLVILFIIWPLIAIVMKLDFEDETKLAQLKIDRSVRISGQIEKAKEFRTGYRGNTPMFWVYVSIPPTMGHTECDGPISKETYKAISEAKLKTIDFYVEEFDCWPVEDRDFKASLKESDHWRMGALVSFFSAFLIYYKLIAKIPFGKTRQSLNERWRGESKPAN